MDPFSFDSKRVLFKIDIGPAQSHNFRCPESGEKDKKEKRRYIEDLRKISEKAANLMTAYLETHDYNKKEGRQEAIEYGYALAVKYGEGAAEKACQM